MHSYCNLAFYIYDKFLKLTSLVLLHSHALKCAALSWTLRQTIFHSAHTHMAYRLYAVSDV